MIRRTLFAAVIAFATSSAFADNTTKVDGVDQGQVGFKNKQVLDIGIGQNIKVDGKNVSQWQYGNDNKQSMKIGSASGAGKAGATFDKIEQVQSGHDNEQSMQVGVNNGAAGTSVHATAKKVHQAQAGYKNDQKLRIGAN